MRWAGRIALGLGALIAALFVLGPYEPVETETVFDPAVFGDGVDAYFKTTESAYDDIRPDSEKRVIWAGAPDTRTEWAVVYLHGFSANAQEIRPVPDRVAGALGANLIYTRFRGHGRDGAAMAEARATDWMRDAAEALAAGRAVGERVIVISTSTGGTIAAAAAVDDTLAKAVEGIVFVSPNFGIQNPMAPVLTLPAARYWVPLIAGAERSFEPQNDGQAREWTTAYPSVAVFPMAAIVKHAVGLDYSDVGIPALFYYSNDDKVVDPKATALIQERWGGPVTHVAPDLGPGDDSFAHVIAGDIMSPGNTDAAVDTILAWVGAL